MILSFDEYQKFYEYMAENLRLKGYEKKIRDKPQFSALYSKGMDI